MNSRHVAPAAVLLAGILFVVSLMGTAHAQQTVLIGSDYSSADAGRYPLRAVQVDSQGRLVVSSTTADGGTSAIAVKTLCTTVKHATTQVNTTVLNVPADGGLGDRWYVETCNKANNAGTPIITCTGDGQVPTSAVASSGTALEIGDCHTFFTTTPIQCISDTAATQVSTEECK